MKLLVTLLRKDETLIKRIVMDVIDDMFEDDGGYDYDIIRDYLYCYGYVDEAFSFYVEEIHDDEMTITMYHYDHFDVVYHPVRLVLSDPKNRTTDEILQMCDLADTMCKQLSTDNKNYLWEIKNNT